MMLAALLAAACRRPAGPQAVLALVTAAWAAWPSPARAETPVALCARVGTDDAARPIPPEFVPAANAALGVRMPAEEAVASTTFRCVAGRVLVCTVGANLPCGKADSSRVPTKGMARWCRDEPNAEFIPAVATGHDTIYGWRCRAGEPAIVGQTLHVDPRGFVAEYWRPLS
jgi:hypothetical protein